MDKKMRVFLENAAVNCNKAITTDSPALTLAVLLNLQSVLDSYVDAAEIEYNKTQPQIRKAK